MAPSTFDWVHDYPAAISVCDTKGTIIALNRRAAENFHRDGGERLVGKSLFACHPEPANTIIRRLLRDRTGNTYVVEKHGRRKLVHQAPWYREGEFAALTETIIELTAEGPTKRRH